MNRDDMLRRVREKPDGWDIIVIGGGATGLGVALDAAARGYRTLLLERSDFAKGTSSRSTKLIHGGVRYLQQGNVSLVFEALRERGLLLQNAPHLVHNLSFVVPLYDWWEGPFYGIGLKVYDRLAGKLGLGPSRWLSREETLERIPTVEPEGLRGGVIYHDGQFDDARLAITLARTAADLDAVLLNYAGVTSLVKRNGRVVGVQVCEQESGDLLDLRARVVINATGVFADTIRLLDETEAMPIITPSQGIHIVLDRSFLPGESAILVPRTDDGRVLFAVPWHDRVVVGTTDTPVEEAAEDPRPFSHEVEFLLEHAARYLTHNPGPEDVLSTFAGLRPLVSSGNGKSTASLARDHVLMVSQSGLVTITGGKWTTYRKMAEDTVDAAAESGALESRTCMTPAIHLRGWQPRSTSGSHFGVYGADTIQLRTVLKEGQGWDKLLHPKLPYLSGEVVWAVRHEMARTVEDVLSRRTRALLLNARASIEAAPEVAGMMARELGYGSDWEEKQVAEYSVLAAQYMISH
jgi:glycerol-3-phosphate dehydrogenase